MSIDEGWIEASIVEALNKDHKRLDYNLLKIDLYSAIRVFRESNLGISNKKLAKELWSTFLFALILKKIGRSVEGIGFACLKDNKDQIFRLNIDSLTELSIERSEFDTVIFYNEEKNHRYYKIQNVRYIHQEHKDVEAFYNFLIEKKLEKYPFDNELYLLINIEEQITFEYRKLVEKLSKAKVPFANIFAIGFHGYKEDREIFGVKIYPREEGAYQIKLKNLL